MNANRRKRLEKEVNGLKSLLVIQFSLQLANDGSYDKAYSEAKNDLTDKLGLEDWQKIFLILWLCRKYQSRKVK